VCIVLNARNSYLKRFLRAFSITGSTKEEISPPIEAISRTKVEDKKEISINDDEEFVQMENQSRNQRNVIDQPIKVLNISFGTRIENRELEGKNRTFTTDTNRIYCLSGIQNRRSDTKLFHKWYHEGELKSKILLNVGKSFNWRTWSYINVYENRLGEWYVVVEDTLGVRHDSLSFTISSSN